MDPTENAESVVLSFKLTRWQRVLNPVERLLYVLLGMPLLALLPMCFMRAQGGAQIFVTTMLVLVLLVFWVLPTAHYLRKIFSDNGYVDSIEIRDDFVSYKLPPYISGYPESASVCKHPRRMMTLAKGFCGTFVLRDILDGRKTVVLPRTCVTYDQMRRFFPGPKG
jgi:hypothetical protein